jgi:hypothetical protein
MHAIVTSAVCVCSSHRTAAYARYVCAALNEEEGSPAVTWKRTTEHSLATSNVPYLVRVQLRAQAVAHAMNPNRELQSGHTHMTHLLRVVIDDVCSLAAALSSNQPFAHNTCVKCRRHIHRLQVFILHAMKLTVLSAVPHTHITYLLRVKLSAGLLPCSSAVIPRTQSYGKPSGLHAMTPEL